MSSTPTASPSRRKNPSSAAANTGKYEYDIMSRTAIFMEACLSRHRSAGAEHQDPTAGVLAQPCKVLVPRLRGDERRRDCVPTSAHPRASGEPDLPFQSMGIDRPTTAGQYASDDRSSIGPNDWHRQRVTEKPHGRSCEHYRQGSQRRG